VAASSLRDETACALLDDYDGAPLLAVLGAEAGERPIARVLSDLASGRPIIDELLGLDPSRLCVRWTRALIQSLADGPKAPNASKLNPRRAFAFAEELSRFHFQVNRSSGANVRLLLERLCFQWRLLVQARYSRR